jgi:hypothetical protein
MPLFWLVHDIDCGRRIFIQKADGLIFARLYAAAAGFDGVFVEGHKFAEETAEKVPEDMIGRVLSPSRGEGVADSHVVTGHRAWSAFGKAASRVRGRAPTNWSEKNGQTCHSFDRGCARARQACLRTQAEDQ